MAATFDLVHRIGKEYQKPSFGLSETIVDGATVPIVEKTVLAKPFCKLLHFERQFHPDAPKRHDPKIMLVAPLSAQQRTKIDLVLRAYLDGVHAADAQVDLFIHGTAAAVAQAVRTHGGVVKMSTGRITSARIPVARVEALEAPPLVSADYR